MPGDAWGGGGSNKQASLLALNPLPCNLKHFGSSLYPAEGGKGGGSCFWALPAPQQSLFVFLLVPSPCFLSPCENGATCEDLGEAYACTCPMGYVGKHCQTGKGSVLPLPVRGSGCLSMSCSAPLSLPSG